MLLSHMSKHEKIIVGKAIGAKVRSLREQEGWSLRELQTRSGVNYGTINSIEEGSLPTALNLFKLSDAFNKSPDYFKSVAEAALANSPTPV